LAKSLNLFFSHFPIRFHYGHDKKEEGKGNTCACGNDLRARSASASSTSTSTSTGSSPTHAAGGVAVAAAGEDDECQGVIRWLWKNSTCPNCKASLPKERDHAKAAKNTHGLDGDDDDDDEVEIHGPSAVKRQRSA
jgi:hypothetical protein